MWVSIKKKKDFLQIRKKGKRVKDRFFFICFLENNLSYSRFAFVFPKWTGTAVERNRFKRWGRGFLTKQTELKGVDVILGFEKTKKAFYKQVNYEMFESIFEKLFRSLRNK